MDAERERELSGQVIGWARDRLVADFPFLDRALLELPYEYVRGDDEIRKCGFATDGRTVFVSAGECLHLFQDDPQRVVRIWMHMIVHCLYSHPYRTNPLQEEIWSFAADLFAEKESMSMPGSHSALAQDPLRQEILDRLEHRLEQPLTAERAYRLFRQDRQMWEEYRQYASLFRMDAHSRWTAGALSDYREIVLSEKGGEEEKEGRRREWRKALTDYRAAVRAYRRGIGVKPGGRVIRLKKIRRDRRHYEDFLRKFALPYEEMRVNPDEFDYIYYTYGLSLYGNMPLIEPLEYRETRKIRDFILAIDTSGSCQGEIVQRFLNTTCSILETEDAFFPSTNIHVIQCDSEIQSDQIIHSPEDLRRFASNIVIRGSGGTDFQPVFDYVDQLRRKGEFVELEGLLYFTDGLGKFPEKKPDYKTAFIFPAEIQGAPAAPEWALTYTLQKEEMEEST